MQAFSDKLFKVQRAFLAFVLLTLTLSFILMQVKGSTSVLFFTISMGLAGFMLYGPDSLLSGVGAIDVGAKKGARSAAGIINDIGSIGPIFQEEIIGRVYEKYNHDLTPIFIMLVVVASMGTFLTLILWRKARTGTLK